MKRNFKIGVVTNAFAYHDRKNRKEDFQRKKNRIIANHLIQFKQIKGRFINSYYKTLFSAVMGFVKTPEFDLYNKGLKDIVKIEYSYEKYQNRVKNFVVGNYDFK